MIYQYGNDLKRAGEHLKSECNNCDCCKEKFYMNDDVIVNLYHGYIIHRECYDKYMQVQYGNIDDEEE